MSNIPSFEDFKKMLEEQEEQQEEVQQVQQNPVQISLNDAVRQFQEKNRVKLLIGTPCYGGQLFSGYFQSMMETAVNLTKLGIEFEMLNIGNESLIPRARNGIVAKFLSNDEYTHLMFIDADITFPWVSIVKLLLADKDLSGGCYPKKSINWAKVRKNIIQNPDMNDKELLARSLDYVFNPIYYEQEGKLISRNNKAPFEG